MRIVKLALQRSTMWLVLAAVCTGTLHAEESGPVCCGSPHVFIFRGGLGYWPDVKRLESRLNAQGFQTSLHFPCEFVTLPQQIEEGLANGQFCQPLVFVGYSSGADAVCLVGKRLKDRGINVQTAILVEPTLGVELPGNVQYCRNYYKSAPLTDWMPVLRGVAIAQESTGSRLENIDVRLNPGTPDLACERHLTICDAPMMQTRIEQLVVSRVVMSPALTSAAAAETSQQETPPVDFILDLSTPTVQQTGSSEPSRDGSLKR